jgi:hypothetical protein
MGFTGFSRGVRLQVTSVENLISVENLAVVAIPITWLVGAYHVIPLLVSARFHVVIQYRLVKLSNMKEFG